MSIYYGKDKIAGTEGGSGKSAYEYAVDGGFTGTEQEFAELLGSPPSFPELKKIFIPEVYLKPETTGFQTLYEYISSLYTNNDYQYIFGRCALFSDLPRQDWGFGLRAFRSEGDIFNVFVTESLNDRQYSRQCTPSGWITDWSTIYSSTNKDPGALLVNKTTSIDVDAKLGSTSLDVVRGAITDTFTNHGFVLNIGDVGTPFQIYVPDNQSYFYKRYSGSGWFKMDAGHADTAGTASYADTAGWAQPTFNNFTWYPVGDDVYIGDHNQVGGFCIKGANGSPQIVLYNSDDSYNSTVLTTAWIHNSTSDLAAGSSGLSSGHIWYVYQ